MAVFLSGATNIPSIGEERFSDNDWATIIKVCQMNAVPETWFVGSRKVLVIDGTEYEVSIIGKEHDIYSDGTGHAPLTFQLKECYNTLYPVTNTYNNVGGWASSQMRSTHLPSVLALMPSEIQSAIRDVNKLTSEGNTSGNIVVTADKLFLLSEVEVFGVVSHSKPGEGMQYEYFKMGYSTVKKHNGANSSNWLRSPYAVNQNAFCRLNADGLTSYLDASVETGTSFAFCF